MGKGESDEAELNVSIVALLVAGAALFLGLAQVFQSYLATAVGYANCGKRVLGSWAAYSKLKFHWRPLRFEVLFTSPHISVCMCGSPSSHDEEKEYSIWPGLKNGGLHCESPTTDDRDCLASWLSLLSTLRDMEWSREIPGGAAQFMSGDVHIVLRHKDQTLDLMPDWVKKPYATTTLSSIVSIAAMLGMRWKQFNRTHDRYVAEGNGFLMTGRLVPSLGIMFSFTRHGDPDFVRRRAIPATDTIEYCFGLVPTIFRPLNVGMPQNLAETPCDLGTLRLGNRADITRTIKLLLFEQSQIEKLDFNQEFPVLFELIGMLGRVVQIPNTPWRMLPNPLPFRWDMGSIHGPNLLFNELLPDLILRARGLAEQFSTPSCQITPLQANLELMTKLREAIGWCDEWLNPHSPTSWLEILLVIREHILADRGRLPEYSEDQAGVRIRHYLNRVHPKVEQNLRTVWAVEQAVGNVSENRTARAIWLVLVFRMTDSKDLRMADLMGTSLPVYIG
ncbi:hypothetical protein VTJ49DRAFT_2042 [Mycothermus thermophilus]|uniref:Modin n=1 Tax=Humicola insolens TaxID=85995 RepID=A0ABR3VB59_HUMIN